MAKDNKNINIEIPEDIVKSVGSYIEAILFASDEPIPAKSLTEILTEYFSNGKGNEIDAKFFSPEYLIAIINSLNKKYDEQNQSFHIIEIAGGYQFATLPKYAKCLGILFKEKSKRRLSQSALETLAIIVFKQPISKPEIENIRGVNSDYVLSTLLEKNLIAIVGRADTVGRPLLYGTTNEFLKHFGLKDTKDLPKLKEIEEIMNSEEFKFEVKRLEESLNKNSEESEEEIELSSETIQSIEKVDSSQENAEVQTQINSGNLENDQNLEQELNPEETIEITIEPEDEKSEIKEDLTNNEESFNDNSSDVDENLPEDFVNDTPLDDTSPDELILTDEPITTGQENDNSDTNIIENINSESLDSSDDLKKKSLNVEEHVLDDIENASFDQNQIIEGNEQRDFPPFPVTPEIIPPIGSIEYDDIYNELKENDSFISFQNITNSNENENINVEDDNDDNDSDLCLLSEGELNGTSDISDYGDNILITTVKSDNEHPNELVDEKKEEQDNTDHKSINQNDNDIIQNNELIIQKEEFETPKEDLDQIQSVEEEFTERIIYPSEELDLQYFDKETEDSQNTIINDITKETLLNNENKNDQSIDDTSEIYISKGEVEQTDITLTNEVSNGTIEDKSEELITSNLEKKEIDDFDSEDNTEFQSDIDVLDDNSGYNLETSPITALLNLGFNEYINNEIEDKSNYILSNEYKELKNKKRRWDYSNIISNQLFSKLTHIKEKNQTILDKETSSLENTSEKSISNTYLESETIIINDNDNSGNINKINYEKDGEYSDDISKDNTYLNDVYKTTEEPPHEVLITEKEDPTKDIEKAIPTDNINIEYNSFKKLISDVLFINNKKESDDILSDKYLSQIINIKDTFIEIETFLTQDKYLDFSDKKNEIYTKLNTIYAGKNVLIDKEKVVPEKNQKSISFIKLIIQKIKKVINNIINKIKTIFTYK